MTEELKTENPKAYVVFRNAFDGWSISGIPHISISAIFAKKKDAEDYVKSKPDNDDDGSGFYRWSYKWTVSEMEYGVDYATDEDEDDEDE